VIESHGDCILTRPFGCVAFDGIEVGWKKEGINRSLNPFFGDWQIGLPPVWKASTQELFDESV